MKQRLETETATTQGIVLSILAPLFLNRKDNPNIKAVRLAVTRRVLRYEYDFHKAGLNYFLRKGVGMFLFEYIAHRYKQEGVDIVLQDVKEESIRKHRTQQYLYDTQEGQIGDVQYTEQYFQSVGFKKNCGPLECDDQKEWDLVARIKSISKLRKDLEKIFKQVLGPNPTLDNFNIIKHLPNIDECINKEFAQQEQYLQAFIYHWDQSEKVSNLVKRVGTFCQQVFSCQEQDFNFLIELIEWELSRIHVLLYLDKIMKVGETLSTRQQTQWEQLVKNMEPDVRFLSQKGRGIAQVQEIKGGQLPIFFHSEKECRYQIMDEKVNEDDLILVRYQGTIIFEGISQHWAIHFIDENGKYETKQVTETKKIKQLEVILLNIRGEKDVWELERREEIQAQKDIDIVRQIAISLGSHTRQAVESTYLARKMMSLTLSPRARELSVTGVVSGGLDAVRKRQLGQLRQLKLFLQTQGTRGQVAQCEAAILELQNGRLQEVIHQIAILKKVLADKRERKSAFSKERDSIRQTVDSPTASLSRMPGVVMQKKVALELIDKWISFLDKIETSLRQNLQGLSRERSKILLDRPQKSFFNSCCSLICCCLWSNNRAPEKQRLLGESKNYGLQ